MLQRQGLDHHSQITMLPKEGQQTLQEVKCSLGLICIHIPLQKLLPVHYGRHNQYMHHKLSTGIDAEPLLLPNLKHLSQEKHKSSIATLSIKSQNLSE